MLEPWRVAAASDTTDDLSIRMDVPELIVTPHRVSAKVRSDQLARDRFFSKALQRFLTDVIAWLIDIDKSLKTNRERRILKCDIRGIRQNTALDAARE